MKIVIFGATGGLGQWTWKAAVAAGHEVVAFVRSPHKLDDTDPGYPKLQVVKGDVMDPAAVKGASQGCQVCINCTSPAGGNTTLELAQSIVTNAMAGGVERFYMVGGLGALWVPGTNRGVLLQDWDDPAQMAQWGMSSPMPRETIQNMTKGHLASMAFMQSTGVDHAFMCPGYMVNAAAGSGRVVTLDELGGKSFMKINMGDVAQVIVDDLEHGKLLGHRVCISAS
ncbi:MAG: NAD(P)H-binding protein [Myxococcota bacterium]